MPKCIHCLEEVEKLWIKNKYELYILQKCDKCGEIADKYIEYTFFLVLMNLILVDIPAYRHCLYNRWVNDDQNEA
ncbi:unnamed protein product [Moneuplotes crassus]|uniref:Protein ARV n=1 Tax=Euplotes crassus TaxID=5936 RepID=A0AAD1XVM1_EUPCR|nr:unnamed protein product [Moneuplotes crassus]